MNMTTRHQIHIGTTFYYCANLIYWIRYLRDIIMSHGSRNKSLYGSRGRIHFPEIDAYNYILELPEHHIRLCVNFRIRRLQTWRIY